MPTSRRPARLLRQSYELGPDPHSGQAAAAHPARRIHSALRPGGRFVFETRHPQARAWEKWTSSTPDDVAEVVDESGRALRYRHGVDSIAGDVVSISGAMADMDGTVLRGFAEDLRFLDVATFKGSWPRRASRSRRSSVMGT